jgi:hypothetical protein
MQNHLFLDLEDTVITPVLDGWSNAEILLDNIALYRDLILKADQVNIYSFAIHDQFQLELFRKELQPELELALGRKLGIIPTVDNHIIPAVSRQLKLSHHLTFSELLDIGSKQFAFPHYVKEVFKGLPVNVVLLDDAVENSTFAFPNLNLTGQMIRVH